MWKYKSLHIDIQIYIYIYRKKLDRKQGGSVFTPQDELGGPDTHQASVWVNAMLF